VASRATTGGAVIWRVPWGRRVAGSQLRAGISRVRLRIFDPDLPIARAGGPFVGFGWGSWGVPLRFNRPAKVHTWVTPKSPVSANRIRVAAIRMRQREMTNLRVPTCC